MPTGVTHNRWLFIVIFPAFYAARRCCDLPNADSWVFFVPPFAAISRYTEITSVYCRSLTVPRPGGSAVLCLQRCCAAVQ